MKKFYLGPKLIGNGLQIFELLQKLGTFLKTPVAKQRNKVSCYSKRT
jgi:hypothetical protein